MWITECPTCFNSRQKKIMRKSKFKSFLRQVIKFILPPIFIPRNIVEIYSFFARGKNKIKYENSFYKRHAFVNASLRKFSNPNYL